MHSTKMVTATCAAAGICGTAMAQSEVSVYGRMNLSLEHQKTNGTTSDRMQDNASRFGCSVGSAPFDWATRTCSERATRSPRSATARPAASPLR
ncbi:porin [Variovorax ureilyticus]|uniref:Porin n=1 Tax=Variovorax ureilyticus TaxID=1836198 RepID=A0ABU8VCE9_9BURK